MNEFDFYLRHASVRSGAWVGFTLAWQWLVGVRETESRPHLHWRPWVLNPTNPNDPTLGNWGVWQWRFNVAIFDAMISLQYVPPTDGRTIADMRADLLAYMGLPSLELKDVDGAIYTVKMINFNEQAIEPYDPTHPNGGWATQIEFAQVT